MEPQFLKFKVNGIQKLLSFQELKKVPDVQYRCIRVFYMKRQKSWITNYKTILSKFG